MKRLIGAIARALIVAIVVASPAFLAPGVSDGDREISLFIGGMIGLFVLFEYAAPKPGLIDFRFAPPYNRARFAVFTVVLLVITFYARALAGAPDPFSSDLLAMTGRLAALADFNFSPSAMAAAALAGEGGETVQGAMRGATALAIFTALAGVVAFGLIIWVFTWPTRRTNFHLWDNMPMFRPEAGEALVRKLRWSGRLSILAGLVLPFALALALSAAAGDAIASFQSPLSMIWFTTLWATSAAFFVFRGVTIMKVARLVARAR